MSSDFVKQFLSRKRKRSRSRSPAPVSAEKGQAASPELDTTESKRETIRFPQRRHRQIGYYKRCYRQAIEANDIGVVRPTNLQQPDVDATDSSSFGSEFLAVPFPADRWTHLMPILLLLLPLHNLADEWIQRTPNYEQILAQVLKTQQAHLGLYQKYSKLKSRFKRYVEHRERVIRRAPTPPLPDAEPRMTSPSEGTSSSQAKAVLAEESEVQPPRPRRITASPKAISENRTRDTPTAEAFVPDEVVSESANRRSTVAPSPTVVNNPYRRQVPNPFHRQKPRTPGPPDNPDESTDAVMQTNGDNNALKTPASKQPRRDAGSSNRAPNRKPLERVAGTTTNRGNSGWISNRPARSFVAEVSNTTPSEKRSAKRPPNEGTGGGWISSRAAKPTRNETLSPPDSPFKPTEGGRQPPINSLVCTTEPPQVDFAYQEVVRKKAERQALKPHECEECGRFIDAIMEGDKEGVYNRHDLMCASRHRFRQTPPATPEDFWELSFVDERDARLQQEKENLDSTNGD